MTNTVLHTSLDQARPFGHFWARPKEKSQIGFVNKVIGRSKWKLTALEGNDKVEGKKNQCWIQSFSHNLSRSGLRTCARCMDLHMTWN